MRCVGPARSARAISPAPSDQRCSPAASIIGNAIWIVIGKCDAKAYDDAAGGDRVDRRARHQPGEQTQAVPAATTERGQPECGDGAMSHQRRAGGDMSADAPERSAATKYTADQPHAQCPACQGLPVRRPLPQDRFARRQWCRQSRDRFVIVLVHSNGSMRLGVA